MSKWGWISESRAAAKIEGDPKGVALMLSEMSAHIVEIDNENKKLLESLSMANLEVGRANARAARLEGWQERVREIDKLPSWGWEREDINTQRPNSPLRR